MKHHVHVTASFVGLIHLLVSLVNRFAYEEVLVSAGEEFIGQKIRRRTWESQAFCSCSCFLVFFNIVQYYVSFWVLYMEMGIVRKRL